MLSYKVILQSLIKVPKKLQVYTATTVNSSKLNDHICANFYNVSSVENCKNETRNIFNDTAVGGVNEINVKYKSFSLPLDVYKKIRKANHYLQITKISHQRTRTNFPHSKLRNIHKYTRNFLAIRNSNRIFKHKSQVLQSTLRNVSSRTGILPPPSGYKIVDVPASSDKIPSYKINAKFNRIIPPPTCNKKLNDKQDEDLLKSSFNITMSKGRKVRPPTGTEKRYMMNSGRISKASSSRKFADFGLLKNKKSLQKTLKMFVYTMQPLKKSEKKSEETRKKEIYYEQHFRKEPYSCAFSKTSDDKKLDKRIHNSNKSRHFRKSYLRPVNLPPPTSKKVNSQVSNFSLPSAYTLEVTPSVSTKQSTFSPLLDILQAKKAVKKVQLKNDSSQKNHYLSKPMGIQNVNNQSCLRQVCLPPPTPKTSKSSLLPVHSLQKTKDLSITPVKPETKSLYIQEAAKGAAQKTQYKNNSLSLNQNSYSSTEMPGAFNCQEINKSEIRGMAEENAFRSNYYNYMNANSQYQIDSRFMKENHNNNQHTFNYDNNNYYYYNYGNKHFDSANTIHTEVSDDFNANTEKNKFSGNSFNDYNKNGDYPINLNNASNVLNKNRKDQENNMYNETGNADNTVTSPESIYTDNNVSKSEESQGDNSNTQTSSTDNIYLGTTWPNNNCLSKNNGVIQFKIYTPVSDIPNKLNKQAMNNNMYQVGENQENKYDCQILNINYEKSDRKDDSNLNKEHNNQENKANSLAFSYMNNELSSERSDRNVYKMNENHENQYNFQANKSNALPPRYHSNISEMGGYEVNSQASNMNNTFYCARSNSSAHEMDENQENKMNSPVCSLSPEGNNKNKNKIDNTMMSTVKINNNNNNLESTETNNYMSNMKESPTNAYLKSFKLVDSKILNSPNNNFHKYYEGELHINKVNVEPSKETKDTMARTNFPITKQNQGIIDYFDEINKIEMDSFESKANQMINKNITSSSTHTGISTPVNIVNMISGHRKSEIRKLEKKIMKKPKSFAELSESFNHVHPSMFIPKEKLWKNFKIQQHKAKDESLSESTINKKEIPVFKCFLDARKYFAKPDNLKKLTPAQIAMYNSIIYYENVIKKHVEEIKRQRKNLESTQQALKIRKNKFRKNNSDFNE